MAVNITGGGGGGNSSAEVRVSTLKIQADRVQADVGDSGVNLAGGPNKKRSLGQPVGGRVPDAREFTEEARSSRSELNKLQSRCCLGFFAVPFAVVIALLSVGIVTFVLKNRDATENCNFNCSLVCAGFLSSSLQPQEACYAAYASGGVASLVAIILVISLLVKVCLGSKILSWSVVVELIVLAIGLGGAVLLSLLLDPSGHSHECLLNMTICEGLDIQDWTDFMEQAKFCVWAGTGIMGAMTVLWLFLSLSSCCIAYGKRSANNRLRRQRLIEVGRQRRGNRRSGERQPLLQ